MIQTNTARAKPSPRTVPQLEAEVERYDFVLVQAQRGRNAARTSIPALMASGDTEAIEEARKEIVKLNSQIADFTDRREQTRDAIRAVQDREKAAFRSQSSLAIFKRSAALKDKIYALADRQKAYGAALKDAHLELDALEAAMRSAGVEPDPDGKGRFAGTVQLAAHLATDGEVGKNRTLFNLYQLSEDKSGIADLKRLASDQHEFILRRVRTIFGADIDPKDAA